MYTDWNHRFLFKSITQKVTKHSGIIMYNFQVRGIDKKPCWIKRVGASYKRL